MTNKGVRTSVAEWNCHPHHSTGGPPHLSLSLPPPCSSSYMHASHSLSLIITHRRTTRQDITSLLLQAGDVPGDLGAGLHPGAERLDLGVLVHAVGGDVVQVAGREPPQRGQELRVGDGGLVAREVRAGAGALQHLLEVGHVVRDVRQSDLRAHVLDLGLLGFVRQRLVSADLHGGPQLVAEVVVQPHGLVHAQRLQRVPRGQAAYLAREGEHGCGLREPLAVHLHDGQLPEGRGGLQRGPLGELDAGVLEGHAADEEGEADLLGDARDVEVLKLDVLGLGETQRGHHVRVGVRRDNGSGGASQCSHHELHLDV
mmetsp:Transcript_26627/g.65277  ORF Transcript_26627/g.65277 Transcript_26627/m.65277 type:complete len:314 (-) Transcript_26627:85-1026(-)